MIEILGIKDHIMRCAGAVIESNSISYLLKFTKKQIKGSRVLVHKHPK